MAPGRLYRLRVKTNAVIADQENDVTGAALEVEIHAAGVGMAAYIGKRFLPHPVQGQLGFTRQAPVDAADGDGSMEGAALVELVDAPLEGGAEAEIVQNGRA